MANTKLWCPVGRCRFFFYTLAALHEHMEVYHPVKSNRLREAHKVLQPLTDVDPVPEQGEVSE